MNDTFRRTSARSETSKRSASEGAALPVAGTSAPMTDLLEGAMTPDAPVAGARPFTSPAAPTEGRTTPNEGEDGRRGSKNRGGRRVVRPAPAGAPPARKPTPKPRITSRPSSGMADNSAGQTTGEGPAPIIYTGAGLLHGADLSRPYAELMREYGVAESTVRSARRRAGIPAVVKRSRTRKELSDGTIASSNNWPVSVLDAPGVDLTRSTASLRREFGLSTQAISRARRRRGVTQWEGKPPERASDANEKLMRRRAYYARTRAEKRAAAAKSAASREVKRIADAQAAAPEPATKTDAWILRELQADMTPLFVLARRWKEPLERVQALAARVGRNT